MMAFISVSAVLVTTYSSSIRVRLIPEGFEHLQSNPRLAMNSFPTTRHLQTAVHSSTINASIPTPAPYPYALYIPTRNFTVPLPSPIPDPSFGPHQMTIYSRIRNITLRHTYDATPWSSYRIGDMFKSHRLRKLKNGWAHHNKKFPSSIAVEYMERIENRLTGSDSDYGTLIQIIKERLEGDETLQSLVPDNRTLVIHLRTGDVIDKDVLPIREFLSFDNATSALKKGKWYTRGLPFYADIWDQICAENIPIDRILVMTGFHFHIPHFRSIAYINEVIKYLEKLVERVDIRVNENPDEDVIVMSQSKYFVESGGGFSRMITGLVNRNGGKSYGYDHSSSLNLNIK